MGKRGAPRFESLASAAEVLAAYDRDSDSWTLPMSTPFWNAVAHAHGLGYTGRGLRVAIVDSGCDLSIPRLAECVRRAESFVASSGDKDEAGHGTAVALLITEVAPECEIETYRVAAGTRPDEFAIAAAIRAATESGVDIINLSLGIEEDVDLLEMMKDGALPKQMPEDSVRQITRAALIKADPCDLCAAVDQAANSGIVVVAAVGNSIKGVSCPARSAGAFAIGFQRERREVHEAEGVAFENAAGDLPDYSQSIFSEYTLLQPQGVVGSSYAAPLYTGLAALGADADTLHTFVAVKEAAAAAAMYQAYTRQKDPELKRWRYSIQRASELFKTAVGRLPHVHAVALQGPPVQTPDDCPFCGFLAEDLYTNFGLWVFYCAFQSPQEEVAMRLDAACEILEAATRFAPWSYDAAAGHGRVLGELGRREVAIAEYERALALRPGFAVYENELARLRS